MGSGNVGRPWERMQSAKPIAAALALELEPVPDLPEEPHALSASTQPTVTTATTRLRWRSAHDSAYVLGLMSFDPSTGSAAFVVRAV